MGPERGPVSAGARVVRTVLRGVAQVDFQPNHWTGLIFLVALFAGGWRFGVFGLLGTVTATLTAYLLGADRHGIVLGLEGFCGTLVGVALVLYLGAGWMTAVVVVGAGVATSVLTSATTVVLKPYGLPAFTAPFCMVTTVMVLGAPAYGRVWAGHPVTPAPSASRPGTAMSWTDVWHGLLNGVGQVFFQNKWYVGLVFLVGLAVSSLAVAAAAAVSSLIGLLVAWGLGVAAADIGAGLYGYNAVLTGIALAGTFLTPNRTGLVFAAVGAATAAALTAGIGNLFTVVGGHTLTWPFVLVTWVFLAAVPLFPKLRRPA
ncbi:urea transporter [Spirillospora sp. NPDC049652]